MGHLEAQEPVQVLALPYAGLPRRLIAFLLDIVLGLVALVLVVAVLGLVFGLVFPENPEDTRLMRSWNANPAAGAWILGMITYILYFVIPEARNGRTLGKRLLGLRVATESGNPIDWTASVLRNLIRPIDLLGGFLFALGPRHRRLGDRAAHTVVLRR